MKPEHPTKIEKELPKDEAAKEIKTEITEGQKPKDLPRPQIEQVFEQMRGSGRRILVIRRGVGDYAVIADDNMDIESLPFILEKAGEDVKNDLKKIKH
jgi:hypothetical protein